MAYFKTMWNPWADPKFTYHTKTDITSDWIEITKEAFDSDSNRRIQQYIEMFKVKKGPFKDKKVKVIHKGKYKVSNDKKNGRPKPWVIAEKGKGFSDADAEDLYNNKLWLLKPSSRTEIWEPIPDGLSTQGWWFSSYEQYGGKLNDTGDVIDTDPSIDSLAISWAAHDPNAPLSQTDQKDISSDMSNNITKLQSAGKSHDVLYEWSINGNVTSSSTTSTINIVASEYTTGDIISLRCFLGDSSSSTGVWKDADETITLNITPLPVIELPEDPGDKAAVTTDDGISLEAEVEGVDGNITLDFDGIENVNTVATQNNVSVNGGGDIIPDVDTIIELSGGLDPLPPVELPGDSEEDYILLRFNPTNEVIIPIMEWYELKLGPDIEIDWDYAGDGDVETFNLNSAVPIPVDNVNTDMSTYFGQDELEHWNDAAPVPAPSEWTEHENWNTTQPTGSWVYAKLGWSTETSEQSLFRNDIFDNSKRISFDLNRPSTSDETVGYVGAWKRWTGPAKPRTVLIKTKNMIKSYGPRFHGYNDPAVYIKIQESNSKINFIKIKGCGNVTGWTSAFGTSQTFHPTSPAGSPEAIQEALRPDLVVDLTQLIADRCISFRDMFAYTRIKEIDLSTLKSIFHECDFSNMFNSCSRLETVELPKSYRCINDNTSSRMDYMFYKCTSLTTIDITPFIDLFKYRPSCTGMLKDCTSLSSVDMTDISFYGGGVAYMFSGCTSLETVIGWNTVSALIWNINNMPVDMFKNCSNLTSNMINNFDNWILVENAFLAINGSSTTIDTAAVNKWISDGWKIAQYSGVTATIDTSNMRKRGDSNCIISNKTFSSPDWSTSLQLSIDLNLSPNRHHEKSWTNGTDMNTSSNDEDFFNAVPWNKSTVELCFGSGIGYNQNIFDVMIDWGDGIIERHSTFNGGTDDRYIDSEYYAQTGRDYSQTGHTTVTHKYISSGKKKTIKILGFCTDTLYLGELFLKQTRQINGSSQYVWTLPNMKFVLNGIKSAGSSEGWRCSQVYLDTFNLSVAPASLNSSSPITWDGGMFYLNAEPYDNIIENVSSKFADWFNIDKLAVYNTGFGGVEEWPESENSKYTLVGGAPERKWSVYYQSAYQSSKGYMNINGDMVWHKPSNSNTARVHAKYLDTILGNWVVAPGDQSAFPSSNIWNKATAYGNQIYYSI